MKKLKINEQQANMLKDLGKTKVLKVTQEQYDRILEVERLVEMDLSESVEKEFEKAIPGDEFKNTKVPGITESEGTTGDYESFINELYGMNEGGETKYEKLTKLMESAGLINNNRLVKEKFRGDKNVVREIITMGLNEMCNGGSEYGAMEIMEELVNSNDSIENGNGDYGFIGNQVRDFLIKHNNDNADGNIKHIARLFDAGKYNLAWTTMRKFNKAGALREEEQTNGIVGGDIVKYPPMSQLRKERGDKQTEVRRVTIPSLSNLGEQRVISCRSEIPGYSFTSSVGKLINFEGYVPKFKDMFGEEPIFKATPENNFLDFDIINPIYIQARDKFKGDMSAAMDADPGLANEEEIEETTVAGASSMGGSSGPFVGKMNGGENEPNVVRRLGEEVAEVDTDTTLMSVVDELSKIIVSGAMSPVTIDEEAYNLITILNKVKGIDKSKAFKFLSNGIKLLIQTARLAHDEEHFNKYAKYNIYVFQQLRALKNDINSNPVSQEALYEQGIGNSGQYDTPGLEDINMKGDTPRGSGPTWKKPTIAGGTEVKIKDKCNKYPYCNQGPEAIAEIAKRTGRDISEINEIINNFKQK